MVKMRMFSLILFVIFLQIPYANAQYSTQKDASDLATLKAVLDFKMKEEENLKNLEALRNNQRFKQKLVNMLEKLSNEKSKNSQNKKIYNILIKAGKDIYNELD